MNADEFRMNCSEVAPLLVFLACDEVTAEERAGIEAHLRDCGDCRALLAEEGGLLECTSSLPQPADELDRILDPRTMTEPGIPGKGAQPVSGGG